MVVALLLPCEPVLMTQVLIAGWDRKRFLRVFVLVDLSKQVGLFLARNFIDAVVSHVG